MLDFWCRFNVCACLVISGIQTKDKATFLRDVGITIKSEVCRVLPSKTEI